MTVDPHRYGGPLLLAVSGGADSSVMARLFHNAGAEFAIAHCNFHLRGEESDGDAAFVEKTSAYYGCRFFVRDFDTAEFASRNSVSIEMAARELRYRWFDSLCRENGFVGVCVAHNANDNAETLILNLLRGCGLKGLCGMSEISINPYGSTPVFRPLLEYTRDEIEAYASSVGLGFRTDSTNLVSDCRRNVVRNEIFPLMRSINPSFVSTLGRDIANFKRADRALNRALSEAFEKLSSDIERDGKLELEELDALGGGTGGHLLYMLLDRQGFSPAVISDLLRLLESEGPRSGKTFLSPSCRLVTGRDCLYFQRTADESPSVSIEKLQWTQGASPVCPRGTVLLDAGKLKSEPVVRRWRSGDWMRPLGMSGKKKVSDILTDLHYNVFQKESALVVEGSGSHVLAIVGERIDGSVKVDSATRSVYRISISKGRRA